MTLLSFDQIDAGKPCEFHRKVLNWKDIIAEIIEKTPQARIAMQIGIEPQMLRSMISRGSEPKESIARSLLLIHCNLFGEEETRKKLNERYFTLND